MKRATFVSLCLIAAMVGGCAVVASKREYSDYRAVRLSQNDRERLEAMAHYVAAHPEGLWAQEFQTATAAQEESVWAANKDSADGIAFYLRIFPHGTYVEQARARAVAFSSVGSRRDQEAARRREIEDQRRQQAEERRRTWMTRAMLYWARTLLGVQNWGSPIADVARQNPAFSRAFGENPRPRCTREGECVKFYQNAYAVPVPGSTRIERTVRLVLRLKMEAGNVERVELLLPNKGFSRWYEMENRQIIVDEDPSLRQQAIDFVTEKFRPLVAELLPGAQAVNGYQMGVVAALPFTSTGQSTGDATPGSAAASTNTESGGAGAQGGEQPAAEGQAAAGGGSDATPSGPGTEQGGEQGGGGGGNGSPSVDELLNMAAGVTNEPANGGQTAEPAPQPEPQPEPAPTGQDLPPTVVTVQANANLRLVVFAAAADDYGQAYDGIVIERVRATPPAPARGGRPATGRPAAARPR